MAKFFLFGSLLDDELRRIVLGTTYDVTPAKTPGRAVAVRPQGPAALVAGQGAVTGAILADLPAQAAHRLRAYAEVFDGHQIEVQTDQGPATAFSPLPGEPESSFDISAWQQDWAPLVRAAAAEIMGHIDRRGPQDFGAHRLKAIETRAAALLRAPDRSRDRPGSAQGDVILHERHRPYLNFFSLDEVDLQYRRYDGGLSPLMNRAALKVGDAAVVLPYDPVRDCVLIVEQFRAAAYVAGDLSPWIWEAPAGLVDPGETPDQAAHREAQEEAHVTLTRLEPVVQAYSSTGSSTEFSHIYIGIADLTGAGAVAGIEAEGEDIRSEVISFQSLMDGVSQGRFVNLHLVTAALWLALHRERLQAGG